MSQRVIEINRLGIHAARRCLLEVEGLDIAAGEMVAVMGPNGAGKTTLLRACLGFVKPTRGEVRVLGCDVNGFSRNEVIGDVARPHPSPLRFAATSPGPLPLEREQSVVAAGAFAERSHLPSAGTVSPSPGGEGRGEGGRCLFQSRSAALAALRSRIGYVPQLLPARSELPLTVREVVAIGRTGRAGLFHPLNREDWRLVDEWIEKFGLTALAGRAFSRISGGEQRKAIIARAMAQAPELLILDEPTANLDLGWRERIVETIQQLHVQTGITIVLVCHELEVLPLACRRVVLLDRGRVLAAGTPEEVFTPERVQTLYGAGLRVVHEAGRHAVMPGGMQSAIGNL